MKERPILFSAPMIRAILDGSKTMTRRVVKPQPTPICEGLCTKLRHCFTVGESHCHPAGHCPYGLPGDRLWVRETSQFWGESSGSGHSSTSVLYRADGQKIEHWNLPCRRPYKWVHEQGEPARGNVVPSIHMPRWASRITLEVVSVKVERLQDISVQDALSEGIRCPSCGYTAIDAGTHMDHAICVNKWLAESKVKDVGDHDAIQAFRQLWDSLNAKKPGQSWESNPWVWVIEFKRLAP